MFDGRKKRKMKMEITLRRITIEAHYTWLGSYINDLVVVCKLRDGNVVFYLDGYRYNDCKDYLNCLSKPLKKIPFITTRMEWWWREGRKKWMQTSWIKHALKVNKQRAACI